MTVSEFKKASIADDQFVVSASDHKASAAKMVLTHILHSWLVAYS